MGVQLLEHGIATLEHPVLVNMLDVADDDAIKLGQYVAQDTEARLTQKAT